MTGKVCECVIQNLELGCLRKQTAQKFSKLRRPVFRFPQFHSSPLRASDANATCRRILVNRDFACWYIDPFTLLAC